MNNDLKSSQFPPQVEAAGEPVVTCQQDPNDQRCFHSNNFPWQYGNLESCIIHFPATPPEGLVMTTTHFSTGRFDILRINGQEFAGWRDRYGPGTMLFAADEDVDVSWESDMLGRSTGWRICFAPGDTLEPESIVQSNCRRDGDCFTSRNFPSDYEDDEECNIQGRAGLRMVTDSFNTETDFDFLTVNGERFAGVDGPGAMDFSSNFEITWKADFSGTQQGWRVCFSSGGSTLLRSLVEKEEVARKVSSQHQEATFWKTT